MGFLALFFSLKGVQGSFFQRVPPEIRLGHLLRDTAGDILLLCFSALGYTVLWDLIVTQSPINTSVGLWDSFLQYLGVLLYFMMVIPPLQSIYTLQNSITQRTRIQRVGSTVSFMIVLLISVLSVARR